MKTKKKLIVSLIIILAVLILLSCILFLYIRHTGLKNIYVKSHKNDTDKVYVRCIGYSSYSVDVASPDEKAYKGEHLVEINDDIGSNVIKVVFNDCNVTERFSKKYSSWTTYKLGNSELSFMWVYTDHGVAIYIGSDSEINIDDISLIKV